MRNITDIDDKIIKRARDNGEEIGALTSRFIDAMYKDADALGVLRPDERVAVDEAKDDYLSFWRMAQELICFLPDIKNRSSKAPVNFVCAKVSLKGCSVR